MDIKAETVKRLRQRTGSGVMAAKTALIEADGDMAKAAAALKAKGAATADKKAGQATRQGLVESYTHGNRISAVVEINCQTDFVARNPEFKEFAHQVALQIASMAPDSVDSLYEQPYIKDPSQTVRDLRNSLIQKVGENIQIKRFVRFELGGE